MSTHPTDEELFYAAEENDLGPTMREHLAGCPECASRSRRLTAGAYLIAATRRDSTPPMDWAALDARVFAAAESTAAEIRRGTLRAPRRVAGPAFVGVALAAAAAGVFAFRAGVFNRHEASTLSASSGGRGTSGSERTNVPAPAIDGQVLLVASPVIYRPESGDPAPLAGGTVVQEGSRLVVDDHAGRAVVAVHRDVRVDVRVGTEVRFSRLRADHSTIELAKGELRVDGPMRDEGRLAVEAAGWTLVSKGGSFVATIEPDVVRVRVLSGKVGVRRGDGTEREIDANSEFELAKTGPSLRIVSHDTRDANAMDTAALSTEGALFDLPAAPEGATVEGEGVGSLPSNLLAIRSGLALNLVARRGDDVWSLRIDPRVTVHPVAWERQSGAIAAVSPTSGSHPVSPRGPRAPRAGASASLGEGSATEGPESAAAQRALSVAVSRGFAPRVQSCFSSCARSDSCGGSRGVLEGSIRISWDNDGHVSEPRLSSSGFSPGLAQCVMDAARSSSFPRGYGQGEVVLPLRVPTAER